MVIYSIKMLWWATSIKAWWPLLFHFRSLGGSLHRSALQGTPGHSRAPKCTPGHCRASKTTVWVAATAVLLRWLLHILFKCKPVHCSAVGGGVGFGGGALITNQTLHRSPASHTVRLWKEEVDKSVLGQLILILKGVTGESLIQLCSVQVQTLPVLDWCSNLVLQGTRWCCLTRYPPVFLYYFFLAENPLH